MPPTTVKGEVIMKVTIDRFEGDYAVCEKDDRSMIDIEKSRIPEATKEGDVLIIKHSSIIIDKIATEFRKKQIEELTKDLWN